MPARVDRALHGVARGARVELSAGLIAAALALVNVGGLLVALASGRVVRAVGLGRTIA